MKKIIIIGFFAFQSIAVHAQLTESFVDGDYTSNPTWTPDNATNWAIQSNQLRSSSTDVGASFQISTPSTRALNAQWEFLVNLQFSTSSLNYVDVYLISELANLTSATNNGYFIRIGGTSDEISLYKQSLTVSTILIDGANGITNGSNNLIRIKVIRNASNVWTLERDDAGGTNYFVEGTATDNSFTTSNFFGIRILQSTTGFHAKHFFDDLYVGDVIIESVPPVLETIQVVSSTSINLVFNEKLDVGSAQNKSNYSANNGLGMPESAILQADGKTVTLTFLKDFPDGNTSELSISGVLDLVGNTILPVTKSFLFYIPVPDKNKDIILTEIFSDPSPKVGLPEKEFLEIYNRSSHPIDLAGWQLSDGSSNAIFSAQIILPNEYWIVASSSSTSEFLPYGKVIGLTNFPTLNNAGDILTLKNSSALTIDSLNYALGWYKDVDKEEGGWSLELIDPNNPCGEEDNWTSSEDGKGGTPGKQNSIFANKPDLTGPKLLSAIALTPSQVLLKFDEKLEKGAANLNSFSIMPALNILNASFNSNALREIQLNLIEDLKTRQLYSLQANNLADCNGNNIQDEFNQLNFALPELADSLEIIINELLFNPRPSGVDFVEVYNNSPKYINLKNWKLANFENGVVTNPETITTEDFTIAPQSYVAFTEDVTALKSNYSQSQEKFFFKTDLPGLSDDEGSMALVDDQGKIIDFFLYNKSMHSEFIKDDEGISLEKISFLDGSDQNWKSATSASGFATPGYINSNQRPESVVSEGNISVEPEIITPGLGTQDFAKINYAFEQPGYVANIKIVDQQGRLIKTIASNETLGFEGFYRWDGDRDDGTKSRAGYYIVWFEAFNVDGSVKTFRKRVVVATQ
jgi:Lamin Tail Domain/Bacterial Ig-like domain